MREGIPFLFTSKVASIFTFSYFGFIRVLYFCTAPVSLKGDLVLLSFSKGLMDSWLSSSLSFYVSSYFELAISFSDIIEYPPFSSTVSFFFCLFEGCSEVFLCLENPDAIIGILFFGD